MNATVWPPSNSRKLGFLTMALPRAKVPFLITTARSPRGRGWAALGMSRSWDLRPPRRDLEGFTTTRGSRTSGPASWTLAPSARSRSGTIGTSSCTGRCLGAWMRYFRGLLSNFWFLSRSVAWESYSRTSGPRTGLTVGTLLSLDSLSLAPANIGLILVLGFSYSGKEIPGTYWYAGLKFSFLPWASSGLRVVISSATARLASLSSEDFVDFMGGYKRLKLVIPYTKKTGLEFNGSPSLFQLWSSYWIYLSLLFPGKYELPHGSILK